MTDLKGARGFLTPNVPFVFSSYPDRLGPAHLVNGYLAALFGNGGSADSVRQSMRGKIPLLEYVSSEIRDNASKEVSFRNALRTILDPDHRVFPGGQGSTFPISPGIVKHDRSDDGFGKELATLVRSGDSAALAAFVDTIANGATEDPLFVLGKVIGGSGVPVLKAEPPSAWPLTSKGGRLGKDFSNSLSSLVLGSVKGCPPIVSTQMAALSRASYLASYLGAVRSAPILARKPSNWAALAPMFCLGEQPPGDPRSPQCRLAIRSFDSVVAQKAESIEQLMLDRLERAGTNITKNTPPTEKARIKIATAFPELSEHRRELAAQIIKRGNSSGSQAKALAKNAYPSAFVASALRSAGRMIGIAGPDRGTGSPRFVLETPVLALLVRSTAGQKPMVFADWLDRVYEQFGIILGFGNTHDFRTVLEDLDEPMPIERALKENHNQLRIRLVRAGLAVEYSDSETEVRDFRDQF
jgi:hypothetical protein